MTETELQKLALEAFVSRRFELERGSLDAYAGVRYWDVDLEFRVESNFVEDLSFRGGERWTDPVIGSRLTWSLSDRWFLLGRGDLGGFGLGSKLSWNLQGGVGWDTKEWLSLVALYRALGVDYENDARGTPEFFKYDTVTHGPLIGLAFRF